MDNKLLNLATRWGVQTTYRDSVKLSEYVKATEWIKTIKDFLKKHNIEDAETEIGYESYFGKAEVYVNIERSEELIKKDIEEAKEKDKKWKAKLAEQKAEKKNSQYETYLKLKKKFEK